MYPYTTGEPGQPQDSVAYTYGDSEWGDLLNAYDGIPITYDEIGNPLTKNGYTVYTWRNGRQLASAEGAMGYVWTYTYDANGMRIGKQRDLGGPSYSYVYNGGQLMQMRVGTDTYSFTYDAGGTPMTISLNGTVYYYVTNLQGDVVAIVDSTGAQVVGYTYDAWGKVLSKTGTMAWSLGEENPLRYRGYVYDPETELYYLQSRYYDPELGRFINADALVSTGQGILGNNMFAYCRNNPVSRKDASGTEDVSCEDFNEDSNPLNDLGNPTGRGGGSGSTWQAFRSTLHHAAKGLQMASGQRNPGHIERHHVLSNKNKIYTPQFKEITDRYNMSLSAKENIISLPGHNGRHTNAYHDFMLSQLQLLDTIAAGSQEVFTKGFGIIKEFLDANPGLPYAK